MLLIVLMLLLVWSWMICREWIGLRPWLRGVEAVGRCQRIPCSLVGGGGRLFAAGVNHQLEFLT